MVKHKGQMSTVRILLTLLIGSCVILGLAYRSNLLGAVLWLLVAICLAMMMLLVAWVVSSIFQPGARPVSGKAETEKEVDSESGRANGDDKRDDKRGR